MTAQKQHYMTPQEVAKHLRVETKMIHAWLEEGIMDGLNVGRLWRIPRTQLEQANDDFLTQSASTLNIKELPRNMFDYDRT
ncbi:MAG: helix-turn-helix domain-containing protein, partial [Halobacteriota archaeon]